MTGLAGFWSFATEADTRASVVSMVEAQRHLGPDDQAVATLGTLSFGRALHRLLPDDASDRQPWVDSAAGRMMVADVRLDNREDLLGALGSSRSSAMSDSELLFRCYGEWGEKIVDRIIGDFAFAVWDGPAQRLILVRDTTGQRPLHYHLGDGFVAFSSMARGLHALRTIPRRADRNMLAEFVADVPRTGAATFFEQVKRVEPGHVLTITPGGVRTRGYWSLPDREIRFARDDDYIQAYREHLDRATRVRMRGAGPGIGAQLSAGLDSGAVAATAARLAGHEGRRVVAFTSAPRLGFDGAVPRGRIADESDFAAAVAAGYDNMDHVVIRTGQVSPLDLMRRDADLFDEPLGLPCNQTWWAAVAEAAQARGVRVLLTGENGNATISAGAIAMLSAYVREGRLLDWWREARLLRRHGARWRGIGVGSFGPWMPRPLWNMVSGAARGPNVASAATPLLTDDLLSSVMAGARNRVRSGRPEKDERRARWDLFVGADPGNFRKGMLGQWGLDERDPTGDRALADYCFALPVDQLLRDGTTRRLARVALADRLPAQTLSGPRGYQFADWYETIDGAAVEREIGILRHDASAGALLDFDKVARLARSWPKEGWEMGTPLTTYRFGLLRSLAAAHFARAIRQ